MHKKCCAFFSFAGKTMLEARWLAMSELVTLAMLVVKIGNFLL